MKKRFLAVLLGGIMLAGSFAGCGSNANNNAAQTNAPAATATANTATQAPAVVETEAPEELVTLQVFSMPSNTSGLQDNSYWAEILRNDLNVQIELLPAGDEAQAKLSTLMASKSLPDIVVFKDNVTFVTDAIEAGLIINLDEHMDALPNVAANAKNALQLMRDSASRDTGAAYAVPTGVTDQVNGVGEAGGPYLRWDLYTQLGMPKLTDIEDYLPVLADMIALEPTNPAGQPNYGMTIFDDWDGNVSWPVRMITEMYGVTQDGLGFVERNHATNTMTSIYDDASYFKRAIKFFYSANQLGLMDPDLITDGWDDYVEKVNAGRSMFQLLSWTSWAYETDETRESMRSYKGTWFDNAKVILGAPTYTGGANGNSWYAISSSSKNTDKALAFLDYMYNADSLWTLAWGEQGTAWDVNADGPYRTAAGWDMKNNNLPFANGGTIGEGLNVINAYGIPWSAVNPTYGKRMDELDWNKTAEAPAVSAVETDWSAVMNARDGVDYLMQHNMYATPPYVPALPAFPDDLQAIVDQVSGENKVATYKMIVAANDAEFDALWAGLVETAMGIGADQVNEWVISNYNTNLAEGAKYMK